MNRRMCVCFIAKSCLTLCDLLDSSWPDSFVCEILQARILEWVAISSSRGSSQPRYWTCISCVSCIAGGFFIYWLNFLCGGLGSRKFKSGNCQVVGCWQLALQEEKEKRDEEVGGGGRKDGERKRGRGKKKRRKASNLYIGLPISIGQIFPSRLISGYQLDVNQFIKFLKI